MEVFIHSEPILFAIVVAVLNTWRFNPLSFVQLTRTARVLNNEVPSIMRFFRAPRYGCYVTFMLALRSLACLSSFMRRAKLIDYYP